MQSQKRLFRLFFLGVIFFGLFCISTNAKKVSEGIYTIRSSVDSNKFLDIDSGSKDEFARMQLWEKNDTDAQKFYIYKSKDGYFRIRPVCSGRLVTCNDSKIGSGITQNSRNDSDNRKWTIFPSNDGSVRFYLKSASLFLDINGACSENGTKVQLWEENDTNAQKFFLVPLKKFNRDDYTVSTKKEEMQVDKIKYLLRHLGKNWSDSQVKRIINNSQFCFGIYDKSGKQVGFARVITDYETTCFVMNVVIDSDYRGKGLGLKLMQYILEDKSLESCRFALIPSNEKVANFYRLLGFRNTFLNYMTGR